MTTSAEEMGSLIDTNERRKAQNRAAQKKYRTRQKIRLELARAILLDSQHLRLQDGGERMLPIEALPTRRTSPVASPSQVLGDAIASATISESVNDNNAQPRRITTDSIDVAIDPSLDFGLNFEHELGLADFDPSTGGSPINTDCIDTDLVQFDRMGAKDTPGVGMILPSPASTPLPDHTENVNVSDVQDIMALSLLPATPKPASPRSNSPIAPRTPPSTDSTVSPQNPIRHAHGPHARSLSLNVSGESCSPLFTAISLGNFEMAKILVAAGAKIDIPDTHGNTPLHQCIQQGDAGGTRTLLGLGANILKMNAAGVAPLHMAVDVGKEDIIRAILERCVQSDESAAAARRKDGNSGPVGAANSLRRCIDARDSRNMTALHLAVSLQRMGALKILLEYGADVNIGCD